MNTKQKTKVQLPKRVVAQLQMLDKTVAILDRVKIALRKTKPTAKSLRSCRNVIRHVENYVEEARSFLLEYKVVGRDMAGQISSTYSIGLWLEQNFTAPTTKNNK